MRLHILILTLAFLLVSCEKELDFKYNEVDSQLVIEAILSEEGSTVSLSQTVPMGEPLRITQLTYADITLKDNTESIIYRLAVDEKGIFYGETPGIPGHKYSIEVSCNGKKYYSTSMMRHPSQILSLEFQWIKMPYDYVAVLQVTFTDPVNTSDDCYWIRLYRNGEAYMWLLSDDRKSVNGIINEVTMTSRKDISEGNDATVLRDGDIVSVTVAPISRNMYDYLTALQADSNGTRMFKGDYCLGYFMATPISKSEIVYRPTEMKEYK